MVKKNESDKSEEKSTLSTEQMDVPASFWNTHDHEALIEQFLAELVEEQTSENFISNESPEESPAKYNEDIDVASELSFITEHLFNPPPVHGTPGSSYSTTHPHNIPYTDDLPVFGAHTVIADWYQPEGISGDSEEFFAQVEEFFKDSSIPDTMKVNRAIIFMENMITTNLPNLLQPCIVGMLLHHDPVEKAKFFKLCLMVKKFLNAIREDLEFLENELEPEVEKRMKRKKKSKKQKTKK